MAEVFKSEERVEIAKVAIAPLASQLGDRGLHVNEVANQFANEKFAQASKQQISSQATLSFVKSTLTQHPELSDEMIKIRTRGMSSQDQQLVSLATEKSGTTGFKRYAYAEEVIREIKPLKPEERGDVLSLVKTGDSFGTAMKKEKAELAQIAQEDAAEKQGREAAKASLPALEAQGRANVAAEVREARRALSSLQAATYPLETAIYNAHFAREVPAARAVEVAAGVGAVVGGVVRPLEFKWALPKAWGGETVGEMWKEQKHAVAGGAEAVVGKGKEWEAAEAATTAYRSSMSRCQTAVNNFERLHGQDPEAFAKAGQEMTAAFKALDGAAKAYVEAAKPIAQYDERVKTVYKEAETLVLVTAVAVAGGSLVKPVAHKIGHVAKAVVPGLATEGAAGAGAVRLAGVALEEGGTHALSGVAVYKLAPHATEGGKHDASESAPTEAIPTEH